jgi:hypothetical protein
MMICISIKNKNTLKHKMLLGQKMYSSTQLALYRHYLDPCPH